MKKIIYIILVIVLLFLLTLFPYLIINICYGYLYPERILLIVYIIISGIFLGKYWWNYIYVLKKYPKKGRTCFGMKINKKKKK